MTEAAVTTRRWAYDLALGMSVNPTKSTLNKNCLKYASSMVMLQHTRLLMAKEHECYSHSVDPPPVTSKSMMCTIGKTFQPKL